MDRDGTKLGYDLALTRAIADAVSVPVIASGGVGSFGPSGGRRGRGPCQCPARRLDLPFRPAFHRRGQGDPRRRRDRGQDMSEEASGDGALVLFSGGQDSTTCLAWALTRFARVETLGFDYGQRHRIELEGRAALRAGLARIDPVWAARLGEEHTHRARGPGADLRYGADPADRHRDGGRGPAQHLRAGPQHRLSHLRRGARLPPGAAPYRRRHVRDGLFRLSRLSRRHHQGAPGRPQPRHGPPLRPPYPLDVDRQGGHLAPGAGAGRCGAGGSHPGGEP